MSGLSMFLGLSPHPFSPYKKGITRDSTQAPSPTLYVPEPEDAVAHGDANLAVNDFLVRASS